MKKILIILGSIFTVIFTLYLIRELSSFQIKGKVINKYEYSISDLQKNFGGISFGSVYKIETKTDTFYVYTLNKKDILNINDKGEFTIRKSPILSRFENEDTNESFDTDLYRLEEYRIKRFKNIWKVVK